MLDEFIIFNKNIGLVKIYDITGKELLEYTRKNKKSIERIHSEVMMSTKKINMV